MKEYYHLLEALVTGVTRTTGLLEVEDKKHFAPSTPILIIEGNPLHEVQCFKAIICPILKPLGLNQEPPTIPNSLIMQTLSS